MLVDVLPALTSDPAFSNAAERRVFQFFQFCTIRDTSLTTDSRFWDRVVLQVSHVEPAVKHAVLALSSYHNSTIEGDTAGTPNHHVKYAHEQYLKALGEAKLLVANASLRQVERVLIVCILFILYEGMTGNYAVSQTHMDNARAIAAQTHHNQKTTALRNRLTEVGDALARMDVLALTFSESTAPYHYTLDDLKETGPGLEPKRFSDLNQASEYLVDIVRWFLVAGYDPIVEESSGNSPGLGFLQIEIDACRQGLSCWKGHWDDMMHANPGLSRLLPALSIELWYVMARINLDAGLAGCEGRFDTSLDDFKQMAAIGEAISSKITGERDMPSFGLDIGFIFPMFVAAIRCRDPQTRRHAVTILKRHRRREGTWESIAAGVIAEKWIEIEEAGLHSVQSAVDVREEHRISMLDMNVSMPYGTANLKFHSKFREHCVEAFPLGLTTRIG